MHGRPSSRKETRGHAPDDLTWRTPEGIDVKPLYTAADLQGLEHLDALPGFPPFVRGPRASMYAGRPWTLRQARVDRGEDVIVVVNRYAPAGADEVEISTSTTVRYARRRSRGSAGCARRVRRRRGGDARRPRCCGTRQRGPRPTVSRNRTP